MNPLDISEKVFELALAIWVVIIVVCFSLGFLRVVAAYLDFLWSTL